VLSIHGEEWVDGVLGDEEQLPEGSLLIPNAYWQKVQCDNVNPFGSHSSLLGY
jgi:hypothetical protein